MTRALQPSCPDGVEPAFPEPPHLEFDGIAGWPTWPPGAVVQFLRPTRYSLEHAQWLVGPAFTELDRLYPEQEGLTLVLDVGLMVGRSAAARSIFVTKARQSVGKFRRGCVVLPRNSSAALVLSVRAAAAIVNAVGIQVEIVDSAAQAIARYGLRLGRF